jgi:hypothetical protein
VGQRGQAVSNSGRNLTVFCIRSGRCIGGARRLCALPRCRTRRRRRLGRGRVGRRGAQHAGEPGLPRGAVGGAGRALVFRGQLGAGVQKDWDEVDAVVLEGLGAGGEGLVGMSAWLLVREGMQLEPVHEQKQSV